MNNDELQALATEILAEMYDEAEPPLDYRHIKENPEEAEEDWFSNHCLPKERQQEIFDKHVEQYDLTESEHTSLTMTVILDLGPTNVPLEDQ